MMMMDSSVKGPCEGLTTRWQGQGGHEHALYHLLTHNESNGTYMFCAKKEVALSIFMFGMRSESRPLAGVFFLSLLAGSAKREETLHGVNNVTWVPARRRARQKAGHSSE